MFFLDEVLPVNVVEQRDVTVMIGASRRDDPRRWGGSAVGGLCHGEQRRDRAPQQAYEATRRRS